MLSPMVTGFTRRWLWQRAFAGEENGFFHLGLLKALETPSKLAFWLTTQLLQLGLKTVQIVIHPFLLSRLKMVVSISAGPDLLVPQLRWYPQGWVKQREGSVRKSTPSLPPHFLLFYSPPASFFCDSRSLALLWASHSNSTHGLYCPQHQLHSRSVPPLHWCVPRAGKFLPPLFHGWRSLGLVAQMLPAAVNYSHSITDSPSWTHFWNIFPSLHISCRVPGKEIQVLP